jgi:hypothetical protein
MPYREHRIQNRSSNQHWQQPGKEDLYIGITAGDFKTRYRNHTKSFRHEEYKNNTELSKYVWKQSQKTASLQ